VNGSGDAAHMLQAAGRRRYACRGGRRRKSRVRGAPPPGRARPYRSTSTAARFPTVGQRDPVIGRLQQRYRGLRPVAFYSPYEAAAWALISARTSIRQASAIKARIARDLGDRVGIHGETMHAFPPPDRLRALASFPGLFGHKPEWLRSLAEATLAGRLDAERLRDALEELMELAGIGPFSAGLILLRGANFPDGLLAAEPRLGRAVALAYRLEREPTFSEMALMAEQWRPYRTWVTMMLRRLLEGATGEIESGLGEPARPMTRRSRASRPGSGAI
jgi:DNA-3-methyladenine glycosylase II